jgi:hypothetical protein
MDIISKIFLINMTIVLTLFLIDAFILRGRLERLSTFCTWFGLTVLSIPAYVIYVLIVY